MPQAVLARTLSGQSGAVAPPISPTQDLVEPSHRGRALREVSLQFVIASRTARGPVMDFGCGTGVVTAAALQRGAHVWAVDREETTIHRLLFDIPSQQHRRLKALAGAWLDIDFKGTRFDSVHCVQPLVHLDDEGVEQLLRKFYRWLYPNGRLFAAAEVPREFLRWQLAKCGFQIEEVIEDERRCCEVIARVAAEDTAKL